MKMGDKSDNKQICRLCLEIVPAADVEAIGGKKMTILDVLLINVDLHVIENAVACSSCMEELQSGFEFKSACLHVENCISTFVDADVPVNIKEVFHGENRGTVMANVNLENRQICRLCMSLIADKGLDCNADLRDIVANCLPEVDIHKVHEPLVCELCFSRLKKLNEFMKSCHGVEQRINNYCQAAADHAMPVSVSLDDLLKFKDSPICRLIKEECSNFDTNTLKDLKEEDIASIKCEEIHIRSELETGDEMGDSVPSGACKNSGKRGSLKSKGKIRQCTAKGKKHSSSDGQTARYRGLTKMFACQECTYKTDRKAILAEHMVTHKDKPEVDMYKCENCEYETMRKGSMTRHILNYCHPKAERKFKCDKCSYETNHKSHLYGHDLIHKKSEVQMHKCETCEFETRHKRSMIRHVVKHRDPKAVRKYKCDKCPYETKFNYSIYKHKLIHKDKSEVDMYKCANCEYETKRKDSLVQHMLKHRDPKAERKFKCDQCSYETDFKCSLRTHNLMHKDKSEVEMHKCENCKYATKYKGNLKMHMLKHRNLR